MLTTEILKHEHVVIERGLTVLETLAERLAADEFVPPGWIDKLLEFFRVFADWCHHAKEEGVLFPALERVDIIRTGAPVGVMLFEHEEARALLHRLTDALPQLGESPVIRAGFARAAHAYVRLLREHIAREDNVLFPLAESLLAGEDEALFAACEHHERAIIGDGVHEKFTDLLDELELEALTARAEPHAYACLTA